MCDVGQFMPQQWNQTPQWWQNRTWRSKTNPQRFKPYNNGRGRKPKGNHNNGNNNNYQQNGGGNGQRNQGEIHQQNVNMPENQQDNQALLNGDNAEINAPALNSNATC